MSTNLVRILANNPLFREGVFLFFPISALYACFMPFTYVVAFDLNFPESFNVPSQQWHAHEMIFGVFFSALAGFLSSATAEWTNTKPVNGFKLASLAISWLPGRIIGFCGIESLLFVATICDFLFLLTLLVYIAVPIIVKRRKRAFSFIIWLVVLGCLEACVKWSWYQENIDLSGRALHAEIIVFIVLFALSTSRINVVIFNLALDPSGKMSPYRPHPGRSNLASFLAVIYAASALFLPHSLMQYYFAFAAAAGFIDRLAEWFIGRAVFKPEIMCLGLSNLFGALGFFLIGLSGFKPEISPYIGLHTLSIGTLGLAVIGVFIIAGLRHAGYELNAMPFLAKIAIIFVVLAFAIRILPQLVDGVPLANYQYPISSLCWSLAFLSWLTGYIPILLNPIQKH